MIHTILIFNNSGKPRLAKFYSGFFPPASRTSAVERTFELIHTRPDTVCNFVEVPLDDPTDVFASFQSLKGKGKSPHTRDRLKIVYRCYATLYFVFIVDDAESELGILDLIQVLVESLDRCFENVCELDLIFHFDEVHTLLSCMIVGGLVLDTSIDSISSNYRAQRKASKAAANANSLTGSLDVPSGIAGGWSDRFSLNALRPRGL